MAAIRLRTDMIAGRLKREQIACTYEVTVGQPAEAILAAAGDIRTIVMATHRWPELVAPPRTSVVGQVGHQAQSAASSW